MKLWFENFPHYWLKHNNFIIDVLLSKTKVNITDVNPDLVIFSDCGDLNNLKRYKCKKSFYVLENIHYSLIKNTYNKNSKQSENSYIIAKSYPFNTFLEYSNFSLLFHKTTSTNIEIPVWLALLPLRNNGALNYYNNSNFAKMLTEKREFYYKKKYCSFICSNKFTTDDILYCSNVVSPRYHFFEKLLEKKFIHSGGKYKNNIGYPIKNKCEYLKDFVFNLAFENSYDYYYTSEKLVEPFFSSCIPIYWGGERCFDFFRKDLVVNANNKSVDEVFDEMEEIYNDKDKIKYMTTEPVIDKYPIEYTPKYIAEQILDRTFYTT